MKVTAIIPDKLIEEVRASTHAKTITDSIIKALNYRRYPRFSQKNTIEDMDLRQKIESRS